jgi:hypothetical protein
MWTSAKQLLTGIAKNWAQLAGGTVVAVLGFVADARGWEIPTWIWSGLALLFVGWAVLLAYHELRTQCDAAMDGLRSKTDHQALADALTQLHHYGTHELLNRVALNGSAPSKEWQEKTLAWYQRVIAVMQEHGCSTQDLNHVLTINQVDLARYRYLSEISMLIIRLERIADVSKDHAQRGVDRILASGV